MTTRGPWTVALAAALSVLACGGGAPRPTPSPTPSLGTKPLGDMLDDVRADTEILGRANATANEVVRNAGDCEAAKPLITEARARLDEAEPKLRTAAGKTTVAALRTQVAKVADLCP